MIQTVPDAPAGLTAAIKREWNELWDDPPDQLTMADLAAVRRLFEYRDELHRLHGRWRRKKVSQRYTAGSNNRDAIRPHPDAEQIRKLEDLVRQLEDRLGLNPAARVKLQVDATQAALTWEQVAGLRRGDDGASGSTGDAGADAPAIDVPDALALPE